MWTRSSSLLTHIIFQSKFPNKPRMSNTKLDSLWAFSYFHTSIDIPFISDAISESSLRLRLRLRLHLIAIFSSNSIDHLEMALQISISSSPSMRCESLSPSRQVLKFSDRLRCDRSSCRVSRCVTEEKRRRGARVLVRSNLDTAEPVVGQVTQVDKDTFWPLVKAAGDKVVVLDMYTQWCGPCKVMAPKFKALSEKHLDVVFMKLDCNQENKPLAKELGIRVVPTFKILKDGKVVKEVTGAKFDDLVVTIESVKSS